ncbi:MAG: hypothetical protein KAQ94_04020 [Arcobacteraceae bacterium]|nr:hypothetical protein [Arcobacteraceae bacterium]
MRLVLSLLYAPVIFFSLRYFNTTLEEALILKAFPLVLSSTITLLILLSYLKKESMILYFAKKFSKEEISKEEQKYIHKSTLFWIGVSLINVLIHTIIFLDTNADFWIFYSSVGWYFLFIFAGIFQFLHRKFVFLKRINIED